MVSKTPKEQITRQYWHIEKKMDDEFRALAGWKFGAKRGSIQKAVKEALQDWIQKTKAEMKRR